MVRTAKHNWRNLFLEYNRGRYKSVADFARAKGLNPVAVRREFKKFETPSEDATKTEQNETKKRNKTESPARETKQKDHPWEKLRKQFLDWPEEKLKAYVTQLNTRKEELEAIPFEELTPAEVKELGQIRRERRAILSNPDPEKICKAVRGGKKCCNPAEQGMEVCWNHGGAPGTGTQPGQQHALKHGLYAKILPDCDEFRQIMDDIEQQSPLDLLWQDIVLMQAQIAWSQKIMFVTSKQEMIKELKKIKSELGSNPGYNPKNPDSQPLAEVFREEEWEFQFSWDRQATFLTAQAKAMKTLEGMIQRYEAMASGEQKLKVEKLKQDMAIAQERLQIEKEKANLGGQDDQLEVVVDYGDNHEN